MTVPCQNWRLSCCVFWMHCSVLLNFNTLQIHEYLTHLGSMYEPHPWQKFSKTALCMWQCTQNMLIGLQICAHNGTTTCWFMCCDLKWVIICDATCNSCLSATTFEEYWSNSSKPWRCYIYLYAYRDYGHWRIIKEVYPMAVYLTARVRKTAGVGWDLQQTCFPSSDADPVVPGSIPSYIHVAPVDFSFSLSKL